jgi:hypothetical protein
MLRRGGEGALRRGAVLGDWAALHAPTFLHRRAALGIPKAKAREYEEGIWGGEMEAGRERVRGRVEQRAVRKNVNSTESIF